MNEKPRETVIYEITPERSRSDCLRHKDLYNNMLQTYPPWFYLDLE